MAESGLLIEVKWEWDGTTANADYALGVDQIVLADIESLAEDDAVWIDDNLYTITDRDLDTSTITISPVLVAAIEEGDPVVPDIGGQAGQIWVAVVVLPDAEKPIEVMLTVKDLAVMPEGPYDPPVAITLSDDLASVLDLPGRLPTISGDLIPPDTLPPPTTSDGDAPSSSPQPEVIPGIGAFYLRWAPPANTDPMRFKVYVSDSSGFAVSPDTFYSETAGYTMTVRNLAVTDPETGLPAKFQYSTPDAPAIYYFRVVAYDADGEAPAGTETPGELIQITGPDIAAETIAGTNIVGNTLTGDLFSGTVVLGSTISTGALDDSTDPPTIVGARVELGPDGFSVVDADGNVIVSFPLSGETDAFIRAHFEMLSADVADNFTMHGTNNSIAKDGSLILSEGVAPPSSPPSISTVWDTTQLDTLTMAPPLTPSPGFYLGVFSLNPAQIRSIDWNATWNHWIVVQQKSEGFRIWRFNSDGSLATLSGDPWINDYNGRTDASSCYNPVTGGSSFMHKSGSDWYIWGSTPGGVSAINRIPSSWITDVEGRSPVLGFDSSVTQYMLAQSNGGGAGEFHVRRFHLVEGASYPNAVSDSTFTGEANSGIGTRINGVVYGTQVTGGGGNRYAMSGDAYSTVYVFNTTGTRMDDDGTYEQWTKPGGSQGFCHNGVQFASVDTAGVITFYEDWNWTSSSSTAWVGMSLYDSDTAGDTANPHTGQTAGQHETPVGGLVSFTQRRRAKTVFNVPETPDTGDPDDPDAWRVYYAKQVTTPVATDLDLAGTVGSPTARVDLVLTAAPSGVSPPGGIQGVVPFTNNFPLANPAEIRSTGLDGLGDPLIVLTGDGSWRLGHLSGDASGNDLSDTGWVTFDSGTGESPFATAAENFCQYRMIGKKVHFRLSKDSNAARDLSANTTGNFTDVNITAAGALPTIARPSQNVTVTARFDGSPTTAILNTGGTLVWIGGYPRNYPSGSVFTADASYMVD